MKQEEYLRATKRDKAGVAREIVDTIRKLNPPGRFLKKDPSTPGLWVEIGNRKAREKTSQALREGAPELREELEGQQQQPQMLQQQQEGSDGIEGCGEDATEGNEGVPLAVASSSSVNRVPIMHPDMPRTRIVSGDSEAGRAYAPFPQEVIHAYHQQQYEREKQQGPHIIADASEADPPSSQSLSSLLWTSESPRSSMVVDTHTPYTSISAGGTKRKLDECLQQQGTVQPVMPCSFQDISQQHQYHAHSSQQGQQCMYNESNDSMNSEEDHPSPQNYYPDDSQVVRVVSEDSTASPSSPNKRKGPRLKFLKARMMDNNFPPQVAH